MRMGDEGCAGAIAAVASGWCCAGAKGAPPRWLLQGAQVPASVEDQRRSVVCRHIAHPAEEDDMIPSVIASLQGALNMGHTAVDHTRTRGAHLIGDGPHPVVR